MVSVLAMLLADGRFPAGSYAHSLGLEQAVSDGLDAEGMADFIAARLRLVAEPEARVAVAARRASLRDGIAGALLVEQECCARCPSPVLREASRRLGAALLRSAAGVWGAEDAAAAEVAAAAEGTATAEGSASSPSASLLHDYRAASAWTPRPVALGVVAAAVGVGDEALAALALYDDAASVASAALKLLPLDPAEASGWVARLAPSIEAAARRVALDERPLAEQPAPAAIGLELAAAIHHERSERLFVS